MRFLACLACWCCVAVAKAEQTQCLPSEAVLFSCRFTNKVLSICGTGATNQDLTYRYGRIDRPELVYPNSGAKGAFLQSSSTLIGGGELRIEFDRGDYTYVIFSRVRRSEPDDDGRREPIFEDGLRVSRAGKPVIDKLCDDSGAGFRGAVNLPEARRAQP